LVIFQNLSRGQPAQSPFQITPHFVESETTIDLIETEQQSKPEFLTNSKLLD